MYIGKLHFVIKLINTGIIAEDEVQDTYGIDCFQAIVPILSLNGLLTNGKRGIIDATFLEESLFSFLHLYQEFLPSVVLTIDVEHCPPITLLRPQMFGIQIGDIRNYLFARQQCIQETDEQLFVQLRAKQ